MLLQNLEFSSYVSLFGIFFNFLQTHTYINKNWLEIHMTESVWTIIPAIILIKIAFPTACVDGD